MTSLSLAALRLLFLSLIRPITVAAFLPATRHTSASIHHLCDRPKSLGHDRMHLYAEATPTTDFSSIVDATPTTTEMRSRKIPQPPCKIRELTKDDQDVIWEMLKYASHETSVESVKSQHPVLTQYGENFGIQQENSGDFGVVAATIDDDGNENAIGAAWVRLLPNGYAYVQDTIPELAIGVIPEMRSCGIGTKLLDTLLQKLSSDDANSTTIRTVPGVSLSCRLENTAAMHVYQKLGFVTIPSSKITNKRSSGSSVTMIRRFDHSVIIREAQSNDVSTVMDLIKQKSEFDRWMGSFTGEIAVTEERLLDTVLLPSGRFPPYAQILLAEREIDDEEENKASSPDQKESTTTTGAKRNVKVVGFACIHFRFSSFAGRPSIWLDDLFVESTYRSDGVGFALMSELKQLAMKVHNATHIGWTADARNARGLQFYQDKLDASIIEQNGDRCTLEWRMPNNVDTASKN